MTHPNGHCRRKDWRRPAPPPPPMGYKDKLDSLYMLTKMACSHRLPFLVHRGAPEEQAAEGLHEPVHVEGQLLPVVWLDHAHCTRPQNFFKKSAMDSPLACQRPPPLSWGFGQGKKCFSSVGIWTLEKPVVPPHHHHKNLGHSRGFPQRQGWTHRIGPSVPVPFNHKDKYPHARHHGNAKNKGLKPVLRVQPTCENLKMRPLFYCLAYYSYSDSAFCLVLLVRGQVLQNIPTVIYSNMWQLSQQFANAARSCTGQMLSII